MGESSADGCSLDGCSVDGCSLDGCSPDGCSLSPLQPVRPSETTATVSNNTSTFLSFFISVDSPFALGADDFCNISAGTWLAPNSGMAITCTVSPQQNSFRRLLATCELMVPAFMQDFRFVSHASVGTAILRSGSPAVHYSPPHPPIEGHKGYRRNEPYPKHGKTGARTRNASAFFGLGPVRCSNVLPRASDRDFAARFLSERNTHFCYEGWSSACFSVSARPEDDTLGPAGFEPATKGL